MSLRSLICAIAVGTVLWLCAWVAFGAVGGWIVGGAAGLLAVMLGLAWLGFEDDV